MSGGIIGGGLFQLAIILMSKEYIQFLTKYFYYYQKTK